MDARKTLLDKLEALDALDEDHLPVVTLDEYFDGNAQEDSIAPNQWGYGRPTCARSTPISGHRPAPRRARRSTWACTRIGAWRWNAMTGPPPRTST